MIQDYIVYEDVKYNKYKFDFNTNTVIGKRTNKPLTLTLSPKGYYRIHMYTNDSTKIVKNDIFVHFHRVVYQQYNHNEDIKGKEIDHIDRNPLNNSIGNIRITTRSQNEYNKNKRDNATSKYFGVQKSGNKWQVILKVNGVCTYVGTFDNEDRAGRAYDRYVIDNGLNDGYRRLNNIPKKQVVIKKKIENIL